MFRFVALAVDQVAVGRYDDHITSSTSANIDAILKTGKSILSDT